MSVHAVEIPPVGSNTDPAIHIGLPRDTLRSGRHPPLLPPDTVATPATAHSCGEGISLLFGRMQTFAGSPSSRSGAYSVRSGACPVEPKEDRNTAAVSADGLASGLDAGCGS